MLKEASLIAVGLWTVMALAMPHSAYAEEGTPRKGCVSVEFKHLAGDQGRARNVAIVVNECGHDDIAVWIGANESAAMLEMGDEALDVDDLNHKVLLMPSLYPPPHPFRMHRDFVGEDFTLAHCVHHAPGINIELAGQWYQEFSRLTARRNRLNDPRSDPVFKHGLDVMSQRGLPAESIQCLEREYVDLYRYTGWDDMMDGTATCFQLGTIPLGRKLLKFYEENRGVCHPENLLNVSQDPMILGPGGTSRVQGEASNSVVDRGNFGPQARDAIQAWQARHGVTDQGTFGNTLALMIQKALILQDFDPGPADGVIGPATLRAIKAWQAVFEDPGGGDFVAIVTAILHTAILLEGLDPGPAAGLLGPPAMDTLREWQERHPLASGRKALDEAAYAKAKSLGTVESNDEYLRTHPSGRHADAARRSRDDAKPSEDLLHDAKELINKASATAQRIENPFHRVSAFTAIASAQGEVGDAGGVRESLSEALVSAGRIEDPYFRASAFANIAMVQVESGNVWDSEQSISKAVAIAEGLEGYGRASVFYDVAEAQAKAGNFRNALATTQRIPGDDFHHDLSLSNIADALIEAGNLRDALEIVEIIPEGNYWRAQALAEIAVVQAESGNVRDSEKSISEAVANAEGLEDDDRAFAFALIAEAHAKAGNSRDANEYLSKALAAAHRAKEGPDESAADLGFAAIARLQAEAGHFSDAVATVQRISEGRQGRVRAFLAIAKSRVEAGNVQHAEEAFSKALASAQRTKENFERANAFNRIAYTQAQAGYFQDAEEAFSKALAAAEKISNTLRRAITFANIAKAIAAIVSRWSDRFRAEAELGEDRLHNVKESVSEPLATVRRIEVTTTRGAVSPRQLQSALAALGFDPGPVDGKIGPKTRQAIAKWQESVGEKPTGTLNPAQQTALVQSASGEHSDPEQDNAKQIADSQSTARSATRSGAPPEGCVALMAQYNQQVNAVAGAMEEYDRRASDEFGLGGLGACGAYIVGYHVNLGYANVLERCPEGDPTGEERAGAKDVAESMAEGADTICGTGGWPKRLLSMEELLKRLTSLTPLDQWSLR